MEWPNELPATEKEKLLSIISSKEQELNLLRDNVFELQGQLQNAYIRIKELKEELDGYTN